MKKSGLKNETQVSRILVSGSTALSKKNQSGIYLFKESDLSDGIVGGRLTRPSYNVNELKKSIDTTIVELINQPPAEGPDTVLRSVYNVVTQSVVDLTLENERLNNRVLTLESKVSELQIVSESLKVETDAERLRAGISENQATVASEQIQSSTIDLQSAIQNSIAEAVERVSLSARNEALLQENTSLREQLFGQTAQLAAGAEALSETVAVNNKQKPSGGKEDIYGFAKKKGKGGWQGWQAGQSFEVVNSGESSVTVTIDRDGAKSWYNVSPTSFSVAAGETKTFELSPNKDDINGRKPKGWGKAREYTGTLTVSLSTGEEVTFNSKLRKVRK